MEEEMRGLRESITRVRTFSHKTAHNDDLIPLALGHFESSVKMGLPHVVRAVETLFVSSKGSIIKIEDNFHCTSSH
jgi:hypothetical protein